MPLASRIRMAFLMTLAVYPVVTLFLYALAPLTPGWTIWQRSLVLVPLVATTIVFFVVPFLNSRFGGFIAGKARARA